MYKKVRIRRTSLVTRHSKLDLVQGIGAFLPEAAMSIVQYHVGPLGPE
jgi:hypothetical protein